MSESFPREIKFFAKFERQLQIHNLSLKQIEDIEETIMSQATDKTHGLALNLFNQFENKKLALVERQIEQLEHEQNLNVKIKLLMPLISYLTHQEVERRFNAIEVEASLLVDTKMREAVKKQLEHLRFAQEKPLVRDLEDFIQRAKKVSRTFEKTGSIHVDGFNPHQWAEIYRYARRVA